MGRIVFRGSSSHPDDKFKNGFTPRNARDEIQIQPGGQMIGGVSTSKDLGTALRYAASYNGWVYVIYLEKGVDVLEYIVDKANALIGSGKWKGGVDNAATQAEIAAIEIPGTSIIAARQCRQNGEIAEMYGKMLRNFLCVVPATQAMQGCAWLDSNVTVPVEYQKYPKAS
ncbi:MAG TPA: hypothetical protein VMH28_05265 [Candidatus Acidoferrales bacterium]|nr:hypothetical protein [Candidatus Acidoferrales bacterium]